jgi:hypothetical protein
MLGKRLVYRFFQHFSAEKNGQFSQTGFVVGNTLFSLPASVKNMCCNGFFLTLAIGRSFCGGSEPFFVTDAVVP